MFDKISLTMKNNNCWINWRKETINDKITKTPYQINGKMAKTNDQTTWTSFKNAVEHVGKFSGIGYVFAIDNEEIAIDIDHCIVDRELTATAQRWVNKFNSYTEISQSGEGIHIIVHADKLEIAEILKSRYDVETGKKTARGELYIQKRYFAMTGNVYQGMSTIKKVSISLILDFLDYVVGEKKTQEKQNHVIAPMDLSDQKILDLISNSKSADKFNALYYGIGEDGGSEDDMSTIAIIAFYTKDIGQIKRMMLNSNRYRKKFAKHPTYLIKTIEKAVNTSFGSYDPNYNNHNNTYIKNQQNECNITLNKPKSNIKLHNNPVDNVNNSVDNLDLKNVKWHPDYTWAKYEDPATEKMVTMRLSEFFKMFPKDSGPEIEKITPMPVKENVMCLLKHYKITTGYNMIRDSFDVFEKNVISRYALEHFLIEIRDKCEKHNFKITKEKITDIMIKISMDNRYNPIHDYLIKAYKYYLKSPDNDVFYKLLDTIESDSPWKGEFIGKFLLQMIHLGCAEEGSQLSADYMLVLQGRQFIGKTTWLRNLLPEEFRSKYFLGGRTLDPTNKDDRIETLSNWLVEMGEISSTFRKADQEALKNFITDYKDKFRIPYAKEAIEKKRRTSLCGTTNDFEYLKDLTGTRRFLTLNCISFDKNAKIDNDMLWGFMYGQYLKGKSYKFDDNKVLDIMEDNEKYINKPEKLLIIEEVWHLNPKEDKGQWLSGAEIFKELPEQKLLNRFTIGRELKKTKIKWKRDKKLNKDLFFVCKHSDNINNKITDKVTDKDRDNLFKD